VLSEISAPVLVPHSFFLSFLSMFSFLVNSTRQNDIMFRISVNTLRSVPVRIGCLTGHIIYSISG
jgi:hypothetical protein